MAYRNIRLWGGISGGKGDNTAKASEQAQSNFNKTLQGAFAQQFGNQSQVLSFLNNKLTAQANNPQGFTAPQMAALQTQNTTGNAQNFQDAQKATQLAEAARGGNGLPSGVDAQLSAQNANAAAGAESAGQLGIANANAQLQQQNYWQALSGLSGVAQQYNPNSFASSANSAADSVGSLSQAYTASNQSQLLGVLGGIAGGAASAGAKALMG